MKQLMRCAAVVAVAIGTMSATTPAGAADIAFERSGSLYTADANGQNTQLVLSPFDVYGSTGVYKSPQVSNTGTHVVATTECPDMAEGCSMVVVVPLNNPNLTHAVAPPDGEFRDARWKPMGDRVVFSLNSPSFQTKGFDIDSTPVQYSNGEDGYQLGTPEGGGEIDGTRWSPIISWNGNQRHPHFAGNGAKLVFDSNANAAGTLYSDGQPRVFITNADGSGAREIGAGSDPSISPNGSTIVFHKPPKSGAPTQIYSVSASGGTPVRLTSNKVTDNRPEWTSDGTKIMFTRCSPLCALYTMTPSGASQGQLIGDAQGGSARQARIGTDFNVLLEKYVPQLRYDSQEQYFADSAATMTDNYTSGSTGNTLQRQDGTILATANPTMGQPLSIDLLNWPNYSTGGQVSQYSDKIDAANTYDSDAQRLHADYHYRDKIYSRVKQDTAGKTWLQYWLFYYYNSYDVVCCGFGVHEGDWEMVQVGLDGSGTPDVVTYAQHHDADAERCTWSQAERWLSRQGEVPVVYVARGSHASYSTAGDHNLAWFTVQDEADGQGQRIRPVAAQIDETAPSWVKWQGQWGGSDSSPRGPSQQGNKWTSPDAFHAQARGCDRQAVSPKRNAPDAALTPDPAPPAISARLRGRRVEVTYRFARAFGSRPLPRTILVTVHPKSKRLAPSGRTMRIRSRVGAFRVPLPYGSGPYIVRASALTKRGVRSQVVRQRVR
jgi:hypothetical protein